jgi:hypothetical protein
VALLTERSRSVLSIAAARAYEQIRTRRWWRRTAALIVCACLFTALVPIVLLMSIGLWRGLANEFSPFSEPNLIAFYLPLFALSFIAIPLAIAAEFAFELASTLLSRWRGNARP